jgi:D-serine deaminase-like pyridoxal phosphate-dependent protein
VARARVTLDVYLKIDCGYHRCGVDPDGPALLEIVQRIGDHASLRFAGLLTHAGHSYHARGADALRAVATQEREVMRTAAARLAALGISVPIVSVGSTPSITHVDHLDGVHEVRVGNYAFFDATQATLGSCTFDDCVLTVLASVVHRDRVRGRVILDAGAIALSKDRGAVELDPAAGYGRVLDLDGTDLNVRVSSVSQEHGIVPVPDAALLERLPVGARLRVLVNHSCLTAAQFDAFLVHQGATVVDRWSIHRGW